MPKSGSILFLFALSLLVACSQPAAQVPTVAPPPTRVPTDASPTRVPTDASPTRVPAEPPPTMVPTDAPPTAPPTLVPTETPPPGLFEGVTPEGYQTLGNPNAPVTLVMYSDFL